MPAISTSAPAKTILFGEHAVVYGFPAIAVPVRSLRARVVIQPQLTSAKSVIQLHKDDGIDEIPLDVLPEDHLIKGVVIEFQKATGIQLPAFNLTVSSHIPIAAGLGSSASLAVAVIRAFAEFIGSKFSDSEVSAIAFESEKRQHGSPSGIDNSVVAFEKPVFFEKGSDIQFPVMREDLFFVLADSGERALTKNVVAAVRTARDAHPEQIIPIMSAIGAISRQGKNLLESGDAPALGRLMRENHHLLQLLEISTPVLDELVDQACRAGAYGAKVCGAGRGGFMVAICEASVQDKIQAYLEKFSQNVYSFHLQRHK